MIQKTNINVIVWDMHGVLFIKNIGHWAYLIITFPHLFQALWSMSFEGYLIIIRYFLRKMKLSRTEVTNEELLAVCTKDNNSAMIQLVKKISCDYVPNYQLIDMVKKMHALGMQQDIASNIGITVFNDFKNLYPEVFCYFTNCFTVSVTPGKPILKKPDPNYFTEYLALYQYNPNELLFIDDNYDNVIAAQKVGIYAIYFESISGLKKHIKQLNLFANV